MAKSNHYYIRKSHRYLGVLLGIQFLCWTIGGLYFSWTNIHEIHGDNQRRQPPLLSASIQLVSPTDVLDSIKKTHKLDSLVSIQLIDILGRPFYQIRCIEVMGSTAQPSSKSMLMNHLADASTGVLRPPLNKLESINVAKRYFNGLPQVKNVEFITNTHGHHEYRDNPLPAYAITFQDPASTTVYVASELGTVQKFRNNGWRVFDFLWMLHTMDYKGRDYLANILLRTFSIVGLITIISGFALFFVSSKWFRK
ncbi:MAG: hypothetical protein CK547_03000 [Chitinophagaceae bacterium]|nr:MAG: hypothetical protein CK547_03000 [Chitinophagaceae bacterium]